MISASKEYELAYVNYYTGLFIVIFSAVTLLRIRFLYAFLTVLIITVANEYIMIFVQKMYQEGFSGWKFLVFINNNFYFLVMSSAVIATSYSIELYQRKDFLKRSMIDDEIKIIEDKNKQITRSRNRLDETVKDLQRVQARLEAIVDNDVTGIAVINRQFLYVFFNKAWLKMTGFTERELSKLTKLDVTFPDDREYIRNFLNSIFTGNLSEINIETRFLAKAGNVFWGSMYVSPVFDPYGNIESLIIIVADVTSRKEGEEKLRNSERRLREILQDKDRYLNIINSELKQASQYVLSIIPDEINEGEIRTKWKLIPSSKLG
jgi:PAS domain S-box-containing protein